MVALTVSGMKRNSAASNYPLVLDGLPPLLAACDYRNRDGSFLIRVCAVIAINIDHETHPFREFNRLMR
jgi:hypothetical protein